MSIMTTDSAATVSGGKVWEIPKPSEAPSAKRPLKNKIFGGGSLLASILCSIIGCVLLRQTVMQSTIVDEANTAPGAIPVVISSSDATWQYPLISVSSILLVILFFLAACKLGTIANIKTVPLVATIAVMVIGIFVQLMSLMILTIDGGMKGSHEIHAEWVQKNYNLNLTEPLQTNSGKVKAKTSDGKEVILKVLHFNDASYLYQDDSELVALMDKLKQ